MTQSAQAKTNEVLAAMQKGMTMEVPYSSFGNAGMFWMLVFRNIGVGLDRTKLNLDKDRAGMITGRIIAELNRFVDKAAFNARGLLEDHEEPSEDVYKQWTKSLKFYVSIVEAEDGILEFSLGAQERNPWDGLKVSTFFVFRAQFYADLDAKNYVFAPGEVAEFQKDSIQVRFVAIPVSPLAAWSHGAVQAGQVPSIMKVEDLTNQVAKFTDEIKAKFIKSLPALTADEVQVIEEQGSYFADEADEAIGRLVVWSGGISGITEASMYSRMVPFFGRKGDKFGYSVVTSLNVKSDYQLSVFMPPLEYFVGAVEQ